MSSLVFHKITINSFAGIDKEHPVVLFFDDKNGKKVTKGTGDMGAGKSSWLNALLYSAAHAFDFKAENFINKKDNTIAIENEFEFKKRKYKIKITKSKFELMRFYKDSETGDEGWISENSPKTLVQEILKVGYSPLSLKEADGKKQIEWIYSMINPAPALIEKENDLKAGLKTASEARTTANRDYDRLKKALDSTPMYLAYEESAKKYAEEKSPLEIKRRYDQLNTEVNAVRNAEGGMIRLSSEIKSKNDRIALLKQELANEEKELKKLEDRKEEGAKWLEANTGKDAEFKAIGDEYFALSSYIADRDAWLRVVEMKKEMEEFETLVQDFDTKKDDFKKQLRDLAKEIAPDVPGLEIVADDSIDGQAMGLYLDGKTIPMLSESELWDFYLKLCKAKGINMVVIENAGSLGTMSVDTINMLAKSGIYIFATEMKRGQKDLKIEFSEELQ